LFDYLKRMTIDKEKVLSQKEKEKNRFRQNKLRFRLKAIDILKTTDDTILLRRH